MRIDNEPLVPLISQLPAPPVDMVMPGLPNLIFTIANYTILVVAAVLLIRECKRHQTPLPILFLIGGMLGYISEPFFDLMVCAWYPEIGSDAFFRSFNVSPPTWVLAPWGYYIGGQAYLIYRKLVMGMDSTFLWKVVPIFWFTNVAFEIPGLQLGLYTYYGPQAFKVFGFPLWMGLANSVMPIAIGATVYVLRNFLLQDKYHVWLAVPLVTASGLSAGAVVGWPMWFALNSGFDQTGTMVATGVVIGFTAMVIYIISSTLCYVEEHPITA